MHLRGLGTVRPANTRLSLLIAAAGLAIGFISCEEDLPPRNNPGFVFRGEIRPVYVHAWNENDVRFMIDIINDYDETLQDTADLRGEIEVTLLRDPNVTRTIKLSIDSLQTWSFYDPFTRLLTVNPRDTVRLMARWNLVDNRGVQLSQRVFSYYADTTCIDRELARGESFLVRGKIQVMRRIGFVPLGPTGFNLCYVTPWIGPRDCPRAPTECEQFQTP